MTGARPCRSERRLIAAAVALLGLLDIAIAALPHPFLGFGQFRHLVPGDVVNGGRFILVILGILLMTTAPGLWTGKRVAWAIALACAAGSVAAHSIKNINTPGMSASIAMIVVLAVARRGFPARSDPPTARRGLIMLVGGLAFVYLYSTLGLYFLDREFVRPISFAQALKDSLRLMFILPASQAAPRTHHGSWLVDSVRVAFLFVMVLGFLQLVRPIIYRRYTTRRERDRVRWLLEKYSDSSIAYFALLPDKLYFLSDSGNAVIVYKTVGANAIAMGDPIGDQAEFPALLSQFLEYCDLNGWACAFHQARPRYLALYEAHGLKHLKIGEEAVVSTEDFSLAGHEMKRLRSAIAHFEREGYQTEVLSPPHDAALLRRLRRISDEWLALGKRRERTFTLGYFDEAVLQECAVVVARAPDGQIVAFADIIPSYNMAEGNFDMLRYGGESHGLSDFLHVSLIDYFRAQGRPGVNLGLAPFSGIERGDARSPVGRAMRLLYSYGGFLFRSKGLREFKGKFRPRWEPRYLVYSGDLQLPGIALAVARAGELREGRFPLEGMPVSGEGRRGALGERLRRYLRLFPGAIGLALLMLLISALTTAIRADDQDVESALGLSVHALKTGRLWVIPIATMVQSEQLVKWQLPIFVFASVALLEYQIGTLRAIVTFFLTDWISSPITTLVIWGLGSAGLTTAQRLENVGGTGVSAAGFGALTAAFFLLREPWRRLLLGGMAAYLVGQFTFERLDVSIAHALAALLGLAMVWLFWRRRAIREVDADGFWLTRPLIWLWRTAKKERAQ
jgi:phosphatidylglycerol lysyltransferase